MTNHPRSPREKFKVGQVVFDKIAKTYQVVETVNLRANRLGTNVVSGGRLSEFRPLTKKEAGLRVFGKAVKPKK